MRSFAWPGNDGEVMELNQGMKIEQDDATYKKTSELQQFNLTRIEVIYNLKESDFETHDMKKKMTAYVNDTMTINSAKNLLRQGQFEFWMKDLTVNDNGFMLLGANASQIIPDCEYLIIFDLKYYCMICKNGKFQENGTCIPAATLQANALNCSINGTYQFSTHPKNPATLCLGYQFHDGVTNQCYSKARRPSSRARPPCVLTPLRLPRAQPRGVWSRTCNPAQQCVAAEPGGLPLKSRLHC